jgi:Fic family protein
MSFDRDKPFNDLPPLPPRAELETRAVLKQLIRARTALADLKGAGSRIPNQAILVQTLGVQEARLSSEIENVVTTSDQLYRALADDPHAADAATKEVLFYNDALWFGFQAIRAQGRPLTTRLFEEVVGIIKQTDAGVRRVPGTKLATPAGDIIYTPPEGESRLRDLLGNLETFLYAEDELDPLVRMAVMHYQFEAIHPFTDGNGRTGRILNILFLVDEVYWTRPFCTSPDSFWSGKPNTIAGCGTSRNLGSGNPGSCTCLRRWRIPPATRKGVSARSNRSWIIG